MFNTIVPLLNAILYQPAILQRTELRPLHGQIYFKPLIYFNLYYWVLFLFVYTLSHLKQYFCTHGPSQLPELTSQFETADIRLRYQTREFTFICKLAKSCTMNTFFISSNDMRMSLQYFCRKILRSLHLSLITPITCHEKKMQNATDYIMEEYQIKVVCWLHNSIRCMILFSNGILLF